MNRYPLVFLMLLVSMGIQAQGVRLTTPAKAAPVDSVSDELASIVVPCATRHQSGKLQTEWAAYLRRNYQRDQYLDQTNTGHAAHGRCSRIFH